MFVQCVLLFWTSPPGVKFLGCWGLGDTPVACDDRLDLFKSNISIELFEMPIELNN